MTGQNGPNRVTSSPMASHSVTRRIAASAGIVMVTVLASRVLGFMREWAVAHEFGSSAVTDAYYAAFTLPDFVNYLVAGASLSITFIPVFAKYVAENNEEEGWRVFSTVISVMVLLLLALVVVGGVFAPGLLSVGKGPSGFLDPSDDACADFFLPWQHFERGAIRQRPVHDTFARPCDLQHGNHSRRISPGFNPRHYGIFRRRAGRRLCRQFSAPDLRRPARGRALQAEP